METLALEMQDQITDTTAAEEKPTYSGLSATYSPDDNKLRLYSASRLPTELYERVRAAGFIYAPKQGFFVASMWTPGREDLLIELCGEIGDEDTSLVQRAEERADRFDDYSEKRMRDAQTAKKAVSAIADHIPFGQPILVGHHSERRARKDAERIENGMRRAVQMWETSEYWTRRAAAALNHAEYKERPDVRQRRIKKLESEKRKMERSKADAQNWLKLWSAEGLTLEQARQIAGGCWLTVTREGATSSGWTAYDVLRPDDERYKACPAWTVEQVQAVAKRVYPRTIAWCDRWISHYENRLTYERAMLAEQGGGVTDKVGPEKGGACKCWASHRGGWSTIQKVNKVTVTVLDNWGNGGGNFTRNIPFDKLTEVMTAAQVQAAREAGRIVDFPDGTGFILKPETDPKPDTENQDAAPAQEEPTQAEEKPDNEAEFAAMRDNLKKGIAVQTVSAPQLFVTQPPLAARMASIADIRPGQNIGEPNGGTGNLLRAIIAELDPSDLHTVTIEAVEINPRLAAMLKTSFPNVAVTCCDFLDVRAVPQFDRILMNPPFADADDIKHIQHARKMLKPGGRLVAICADGPRQNATLRPMVEELGGVWEPLPPGTFKDSGTMVNSVLLWFDA